MPLSDAKVRAAKPAVKDYKLADEKGLFLLVKTSGSRYWRMKYRIAGKEKLLSIGVYPDTTLAAARLARDEARTDLANGIDPSAQKQARKVARRTAAENSFEVVALEWLTQRGKRSEGGDKRLKRLLHRDLFPDIGAKPVAEINPTDLLATLRKIEKRGAIETAHRAKQVAGMVFRYAIATGRAERDPSADLKGALRRPHKTHFAAITKPDDVATLMRAIDAYNGTPIVSAALKLSPLLFCRPGELRHLEWTEINHQDRRIEISASKMKINQDFIIPLSTQAMTILNDLHQLTGNCRYVFPSARSSARAMSDNAVRVALRTIGYTNEQMCPHGFRAMARTLLDEVLGFPVDWIEQQLAHNVKDTNGRAYNRTKHLSQRSKMMQAWADYLDRLKSDNPNVIELGSNKVRMSAK